MAEVREFTLPDLGEGLTEATVVRWLVEVGEVVAVDQPVVEVETAKALVDVPCPYGGVVTARYGDEGTELPVGSPLLTVAVGSTAPAGQETGGDRAPEEGTGDTDAATGGPGEAGGAGEAGVAGEAGGAGKAGGTKAGGAAEGSGNVLVGYGTSAASARRRRVRPTAGAGAADAGAAGAGAAGAGAVEPARRQAALEGPVPVISPLVRRLAREHGLDLREIRGSGPEGLVLRTDVERAVRARSAAGAGAAAPGVTGAPAATGTAGATGATGAPGAPGSSGVTGAESGTAAYEGLPGEAERIPLRGMRGAAAEKFRRSRQEIPDATCWVDADATELLAARREMNAVGGAKVSLLALLARVCTAALARYPQLNATVDTAANEIVRLPAVHLGFAAQTDRGLVVPVVRDAHRRTAEGLTAEMARLTEAARAGSLGLAELTHGTFTLNNYGVFGVDGSTPIINHPEAAMLGVGRIAAKPWVHEGELAIRQVVQLSLTFDHRVCDGGTAGGFLRFVADCVERPAVLLRTL
ncbi:2-oxo acid dehydrogenase subunit E2 [Streptomyces albofaciens JCM 4342]|uniref:dihydrolipoamide acetyltransferase family protein n=1 Tax=Streptomyces albofaciens TaxID=66866 RepID=UPI00123C19E8|nr:dihydrolipoamide acetyltransferase family protein [Streptomyces albofaciens]KAA6220820.1 2-oxo acid dehydrogenase subunit E2 [Streptomyces albofaciens JCM 4342]